MKKIFKLLLAGGAVLSLVGCVMTTLKTYEEPGYALIKTYASDPIIETRRYDAELIAEVEVTGAREDAVGDGFRLLADYIFGGNVPGASIDMTTPVAQQAVSPKGQPIDMTTPVAQQQTDTGSWLVRFYMPQEYTMQTLPMPKNDQVTIRELAGYDAVVIRFSGRGNDENMQKHQAMLDALIAEQKLGTTGEPTFAFYDPPWTPWFMRRNEIMYRLSPVTGASSDSASEPAQ